VGTLAKLRSPSELKTGKIAEVARLIKKKRVFRSALKRTTQKPEK